MASWGRKDLLGAIRLYQDETGILEYRIEDVAAWAERRNFEMPKPPTAIQMLTKKLRKAARSEHRSDPDLAVDYRGNLVSYRMDASGQMEYFWFDADGPAATMDAVSKANHLRREQMINDGVQIAATERRWNATHSGHGKLQTDLDLNDEVTWRLNAPEEEVGERKAS